MFSHFGSKSKQKHYYFDFMQNFYQKKDTKSILENKESKFTLFSYENIFSFFYQKCLSPLTIP